MNHEGSIGGIGSAELKQDTTFPRQPVVASRTCSWAIRCGRSQSVSAFPEHHSNDVNADGVTNILKPQRPIAVLRAARRGWLRIAGYQRRRLRHGA